MNELQSSRSLSSRLIGSAQALACSAFSGVAGLEAELTNAGPETKSTRILVRGRAAHFDKPHTQPHDSRILKRRRNSAFRTPGPRDELERTNCEVAAFLEGPVDIIPVDVQSSDLTMDLDSLSSSTYLAIMDPKANASPLRLRKQTRVNQDPYGGDGFIWDDADFFSDYRHDNGSCAAGVQHVDDQCAESMDWSATEDESEMLSVAAHRLRQVQRHFATLLLERKQQQDLSAGERILQQIQWHESHSLPKESSQAHHASQRSHDATPSSPHAAPPQQEAPKKEEWEIFRCPYFECHQILASQKSRMHIPSRACVHTGCDYSTPTSIDWLMHVMRPHHDLQTPPLLGEVKSEYEIKASL